MQDVTFEKQQLMPQEQISKNLVYSDAPQLSRDSSLTEGINCDQERVSILP